MWLIELILSGTHLIWEHWWFKNVLISEEEECYVSYLLNCHLLTNNFHFSDVTARHTLQFAHWEWSMKLKDGWIWVWWGLICSCLEIVCHLIYGTVQCAVCDDEKRARTVPLWDFVLWQITFKSVTWMSAGGIYMRYSHCLKAVNSVCGCASSV